jgi:hypothetical protein
MASRLADYLRPTTLHQAANVLLETISSSPVASLDSADMNTDAETALNRLGESLRETQEEGWDWNTEVEYILEPNEAGEILLPANVLKAVQLYTSETHRKRLSIRGRKLYDTRGHTYIIGESVKADVVVALDFEELPEAARWYVTLKAGRRFANGKTTSSQVYQFTKADEDAARLRLEQAEAETSHDTMHENPHIRRVNRKRL